MKKETPFDGLRNKQKKKQETIFTSGGETIHKLIQAEYAMQNRLGAAEGILYDKNNLLISKVDVTLKDGTPIEVKSIGIEELREMDTPKFEHAAQLAYYVKSQGLQKGYVQYVARENTGVRKIFEVDRNGLFKVISDVSTQYMIDRRGGTSPSKFNFAFEEGLSSFRSNDYYTENYRSIAEEAKMFQSRLREIKRKKDWLQTYRQLTSGLYEKNALAVSGVNNNFDNQTMWGSPFKKKKEDIVVEAKKTSQRMIEQDYPVPKASDLKKVLREKIVHDYIRTPEKKKSKFIRDVLSKKQQKKGFEQYIQKISNQIGKSPEILKQKLLEESHSTLEDFIPNFMGKLRLDIRKNKENTKQLQKTPVDIARQDQLRAASSLRGYDGSKVRFLSREEAAKGPLGQLIGEKKVGLIYDQLDARSDLKKNLFHEVMIGKDVSLADIPEDIFTLDRKGNTLAPPIVEKKRKSFLKSIMDRRDKMVKQGTDKEYFEREYKRANRKKRARDSIGFSTKELIQEQRGLKENLASPQLRARDKALLFFDIETSYGKQTSSNFILEFAGTRLDKSAVEEVKSLQGLENLYRKEQGKLTKNALHVEGTILNSDLILKIKEATHIDQLIKEDLVGKETLSFYQTRAEEQIRLGRKPSILKMLQEDVEDLVQTTGSMKDGAFSVSKKYSGFKQVSNFEDFILGQKNLISEVNTFFAHNLDERTALAGHNIGLFDVGKLSMHAEDLRAEIKGIRKLAQADKVDTLTSDMAKSFFQRVREVSKDFEPDLRAAFFEKEEIFGGEKKKTIRSLEMLSKAMGFGQSASYSGQAHQASYDVFQQNIPVYSYMEEFLGANQEKQASMAKSLLENYSGMTEVNKHLPEIKLDKKVFADTRPIKPLTKPSVFSEVMKELTAEAQPVLKKIEHNVRNFETIMDYFLSPKNSQVHSTYMRRPGLGIAGLAAGGMTIVGVAFSSLFSSSNTKPIRPTANPLIHEDAAVFPEQESQMKIQQRVMTDFGSGYQGLKNLLQAPAVSIPHVKNLAGKINQAPRALLSKGEHQALNVKRSIPSPPQVIENTKVTNVKHPDVDFINKIKRKKKWRALNQNGSMAAFEGNMNRTGHHRM